MNTITVDLKYNTAPSPDLPARIDVVATDAIDSTMQLRVHSRLHCQISVRQEGKGELPCTLLVSAIEELPARLGVRGYQERSLEFDFNTNHNPDLLATINVNATDNLPCTLTPNIHSMLDSKIDVRTNAKEELPARVDVKYRDDSEVNSTITVRGVNDRSIEFSYTVPYADGTMLDELDSSINVNSVSQIDCTMAVNNASFITGTIDVIQWDTLDATLTVGESIKDSNEITATMTIPTEANNNLLSSVSVKTDSNSSIEFNYNTHTNPDLPCTLYVLASDEIKCSLQPKIHNTLLSVVDIRVEEHNDLLSRLEVKYRDNSEVAGSITVRGFEQKGVEFVYLTNPDPSLPASITVEFSKDLRSFIEVAHPVEVFNQLPAKIDVVTYELFPATAFVCHPSDLQSTMQVSSGGTSTLELTYSAVTPPTYVEDIKPSMDTFVDRTKPTFGYYGDATKFMVGSQDDYRGLIKFDVSSDTVPDDAMISSAKLRLTSLSPNNSTISIHLAQGDWNESTTWSGQPSYDPTPLYTFTNDGQVELDVIDLVEGWRTNVENFGIVLVSSDSTSEEILSYEYNNSDQQPTLEVVYELPEWNGWLEVDDLTSKLEIPHSSDLSATMEIRSYTDVIGSMYVREPNEIYGEFSVSKPDLTSTIDVSVVEYDELTSSLTVVERGFGEINGTITITRPNFPANIEVNAMGVNELNSSVSVQKSRRKELPATLTPSWPAIGGTLFVAEKSEMPSTITVMKDNQNEDFDGTVTVSRRDMVGHLELGMVSQIDGTIGVRNWVHEELPSSLTVSQVAMKGSMQLVLSDNLDSTVAVRQEEQADIPSTLVVSRPNVQGTMDLRIHDWIDGTLGVKAKRANDLSSVIKVIKMSMPARLEVEYSSKLKSRLNVRTENHYDMPSRVRVRGKGDEDFLSTLTVTWHDEITGSIEVEHKVLLPATMTVSEFDISDIYGTMMVFFSSDMPSTMTVVKNDYRNLWSTLDIPAYDDSNLSATATINSEWVAGNTDFSANIDVQQSDGSDINGTLEITEWDQINATITVRQNVDEDLSSTIDVQQSDESEIPSHIALRFHSDISCSIDVRQTDESKITCTMIVRQTDESDLDTQVTVRVTANEDFPAWIKVMRDYPTRWVPKEDSDTFKSVNHRTFPNRFKGSKDDRW